MRQSTSEVEERFSMKRTKRHSRKNEYGYVLVLIAGLIVTILAETLTGHVITDNRMREASYEAEVRMTAIQQEFRTCITVTDSMALILRETQGDVRDFEYIARSITDQNVPVSSVQLAPDGKVTYIYPEEGNEAGKIDLFADPDRKEEAEYARDTGETMVAGPFELRQGGNGMAIRKPVYLGTDQSEDSFWGFSIVILMTSKLLSEAHIDRLNTYGYKYRLTQTFRGRTSTVDENFSGEFHHPIEESRQLYGKTWTLSLEPRSGWMLSYVAVFIAAALLAITALAAALVWTSQRLKGQNEYQDLSAPAPDSDELTGLLCRDGYDRLVQAYMADHKTPCIMVAMDVNHFRLFNDLYGHAAGDRLLVSLAVELKLLSGNDAYVSRNRGDDFQIFFIETETPAFEKLRTFIGASHAFSFEGKNYTFSLSAGYAVYPEQAEDFQQLCRKANRALCYTKLVAGESFCCYEEHMEHDLLRAEHETMIMEGKEEKQ